MLGFALPTEQMRENIRSQKQGPPPDLANPSMRSLLAALPHGTARVAAFETRIWWSPGSAPKTILAAFREAGYRVEGAGERFLVTGR